MLYLKGYISVNKITTIYLTRYVLSFSSFKASSASSLVMAPANQLKQEKRIQEIKNIGPPLYKNSNLNILSVTINHYHVSLILILEISHYENITYSVRFTILMFAFFNLEPTFFFQLPKPSLCLSQLENNFIKLSTSCL